MSGSDYTSVYKGRVVNNSDPLALGRLILQVSVMGNQLTPWAEPGDPKIYKTPKNGDSVFVTFHGGNLSQPVWWGNGEIAVPGQMAVANGYTDFSSASTLASAESYASQTTFRGRIFNGSAQSIAGDNGWHGVSWSSEDGWDALTNPPITTLSMLNGVFFVRVPVNGEYLYSYTFGVTGAGTTGVVGARAMWKNVSSGQNWVIAGTGPLHFGPDLWDSQFHLTFATDQQPGVEVFVQIRSSADITVQPDNVFISGSSGPASRTRGDITCIRRYA